VTRPPADIDVLMITHRRPTYVDRSLSRLLDSADASTRVWLWHNGDDTDTLSVVQRHAGHPAVAELVTSEENAGIRGPTNWLWRRSAAAFVSKVDDDCLVDPDWVDKLRFVHRSSASVGVVGSWRFYDQDFDPTWAMAKVQRLPQGARILRNHWVQGSGYLARRSLVDTLGPIRETETFNDWCIRGARHGYINGWAIPFVHEEHMDDPRSPFTMYTDDEVFRRYRPLSAVQLGVDTVRQWEERMRESAQNLQRASLDLDEYSGWRPKVRQRWRQAQRRLRVRGNR
jgi:GT2 family glycosyltransferase